MPEPCGTIGAWIARGARGAGAVAVLASLAVPGGCANIPKGIEAVRDFDVERYQGTWYEIARFDSWFERGLSDVTATYTLREDGRIGLVNRGWDVERGEWRETPGVAELKGDRSIGEARLSVSFLWPFVGGYNVIEIDEPYTHALVCGDSREWLWILARDPDLPLATRTALVDRARTLGFAVDELLWVEHGVAPRSERVMPTASAPESETE